ncbi:hypothetical protein FNF27_02501 [Cafeteria roenbergensis]|uniref:Enoyl-CoA hydratase domain-containing protein 3, mitochondrial n=1 Tax=Cafeteria roenbergensis TaxID=33653 RepID=A0A5A8EF12_CAFRO|nr:hypothetical protein FNF27_02501 [Cafeteria roenbergensis]
MLVFQRGRSCRAHPFKDTGSRDGFVVLSERAVALLAASVAGRWGADALRDRFHGQFRGEVAGADPGRGEVERWAALSMYASSVKGVEDEAPDVRAQGGSPTALQAVRTALVVAERFLVGGRPVVEVAFVKATEVGPPGCGDATASMVEPTDHDSTAGCRTHKLSAVAERAGLSPEQVASAGQNLWGRQAPLEDIERQDDAHRAVMLQAWPTTAAIGPAAKALKAGRSFRPCWPKLHWRMREAAWASDPATGRRVAVLPFTLAAMNNSGQPDHKPPATWLAFAVRVRLAASPAPWAPPGDDTPAGAAAVSQPFAMVSCNERPRCLDSRNNRRLAFMPVLDGPAAAGVDVDGPAGERLMSEFHPHQHPYQHPYQQAVPAPGRGQGMWGPPAQGSWNGSVTGGLSGALSREGGSALGPGEGFDSLLHLDPAATLGSAHSGVGALSALRESASLRSGPAASMVGSHAQLHAPLHASLVRADSRLDGKVAVLTLASARTRNALSEAMVRDLHAAVEAASNDERVRAIVLTHDGPVFSAGHDLKQVRRWQAEGNTDALGASFAATAAVARMLRLTAPPTIAVVNGLATAAGCQLALSCDMVVASNGSAFATPGSSVGLFCTSPAVAVMAAAPSKLAAEMLLCGKPIPAARALAFGMINYVSGGDATGACDDEAHRGAMDKAMELAEAVASHPRDVIAFGKRATARVGCAPTLDQADQLAGAAMVENCAMPDASEGISAFTEKRTPSWRK